MSKDSESSDHRPGFFPGSLEITIKNCYNMLKISTDILYQGDDAMKTSKVSEVIEISRSKEKNNLEKSIS
ncbi:MAG TPA: hypothetical protein VK186_21315 [Candidatus Deferrimicrobium sp.]|nr:hypothetical protein [Candidatus Deferrimicrobium sp.]